MIPPPPLLNKQGLKMESFEQQAVELYDKAVLMAAEYGAQLIAALLVLIVGLWIK